MEEEQAYIDVYPVGFLSDFKYRKFKTIKSRVLYMVRGRNWHGLRQYFNGYLAEVSYGNLIQHKCGRGWTKKAALSSLGRRLGESNPAPWER